MTTDFSALAKQLADKTNLGNLLFIVCFEWQFRTVINWFKKRNPINCDWRSSIHSSFLTFLLGNFNLSWFLQVLISAIFFISSFSDNYSSSTFDFFLWTDWMFWSLGWSVQRRWCWTCVRGLQKEGTNDWSKKLWRCVSWSTYNDLKFSVWISLIFRMTILFLALRWRLWRQQNGYEFLLFGSSFCILWYWKIWQNHPETVCDSDWDRLQQWGWRCYTM